MRNFSIVTGFTRLGDAAFLEKATFINDCMTGNAHFPNPSPAIADISAAVSSFASASSAAKTRDMNAVALKNQRREDLEVLLVQLSRSVTSTANGDRAMLVSSGFSLAKTRQPAVITKPENLQLMQGENPGELVVSVSAVKGAKSYVHEFTTNPEEDSWTAITTTSSKYTHRNLDPETRYWCRVAAIGANDQAIVSDTLSRFVL